MKQCRVLLKHLVQRLFYHEHLNFENQKRESLIFFMAVLVIAGGYFAHKLFFPYLWMPTLTGLSARTIWLQKTYFTTVSMALTGIISVINWGNIFLDNRDYQNLLVLPIKTRRLFFSKFLSLLVYVAFISVLFNVLAVLVMTGYLADKVKVNPLYLSLTHLTAIFLANLFVFLAAALIQAAIMIIFKRELLLRISNFIQMVLLLGFVSVFVWFPRIYPSLAGYKENLSSFLYYFPPLWFVGLHEKLIGSSDIVFTRHLYTALAVLILGTALYLLSLSFNFKKFLNQSAGTKNKPKSFPTVAFLRRIFNGLFLKNPQQRAIFYFSRHTIKRSRKHKLMLAVYLGMPLSLIVTELIVLHSKNSLVGSREIGPYLGAMPLILYFFLVLGLRMAVNQPVMLEARWVFRLAEWDRPKHYIRGLKKALFFMALFPLFLISFFFYLYCSSLEPALFHSIYCLAVALVLLEVFFLNYRRIPFTSEYTPLKLNIKVLWPAYIWAFFTYLSAFSTLGQWLLENPGYYTLFYPAAALLLILLKVYQHSKSKEPGFSCDEEPEPVMLSLGLDR